MHKTHKLTVSKNKLFGYQKDIYVQDCIGVLKIVHTEWVYLWGLMINIQ